MTVLLDPQLPAFGALANEGVAVANRSAPGRMGMAPLRVALINLMPDKPTTETQFARALGSGPAAVELTLVLPDGYHSNHSSAEHLAFYRRFGEIAGQRFDGVIVTGAPVETLPFEAVTYWTDLTRIFDWARTSATSTLAICWAAQAALFHFHRVQKRPLATKKFGIFPHRVLKPDAALMRGMGGEFLIPVSRHTEVSLDDLPIGVELLAASDEAGLCIVTDAANRLVCNFNHLEYDADTLNQEFLRDRLAGRPVPQPAHYFPADDPSRMPVNSWRPFASIFFGNWIAELERKRRVNDDTADRLHWLVQRPIGVVGRDELRVVAANDPDAMVAMLRGLAAAGLSSRVFRSRRLGPDRQVFELSLDAAFGQDVQRSIGRLLRSPMFFQIAYRRGDGTSGFIAVSPAEEGALPQSEQAAAAG